MKYKELHLILRWVKNLRAVVRTLCRCWVLSAVPEICRGLCIGCVSGKMSMTCDPYKGLMAWERLGLLGIKAVRSLLQTRNRNAPRYWKAGGLSRGIYPGLSRGSSQNNPVSQPFQIGFCCAAQVGLGFQDFSNPPASVSGVVEIIDAHYYLLFN